ncbi:MAG: PBSX family phage terminase large subunit [Ruminococcus sp.]|nr:PBSX family phage terminase large subunit [Ruminococcus sp.]
MIFTWAYLKPSEIMQNSETDEYKGIIADGAVRTGKTICMSVSFILWAMKTFDGKSFGICGKTVRSVERNIIRPLGDVSDLTKFFKLDYRRSESCLIISQKGKSNRFYIFGGKDESSYMLIQGITLSGVMFDEAALSPASFIEQACARTISEAGAKLWFNCNPGSKRSYFYQNWILKAHEKHLLRLSLLMKDNPILSKKQIEEAETMYTGVFRDRYILGKWVDAEGIIYREFAENPEKFLLDEVPDDLIYGVAGLDFGGNGSAHAAILVGFTRNFSKMVVLDEYYRREIITPARLESEVTEFIKKSRQRILLRDLYCDSAEQVLIKGLKARFAAEKIPINVHNAKKGAILDRIAFENLMFSKKRLFIMRNCVHLIEALETAVWDNSGKRLDDGSVNIDSLDALEYAAESQMKQCTEYRM